MTTWSCRELTLHLHEGIGDFDTRLSCKDGRNKISDSIREIDPAAESRPLRTPRCCCTVHDARGGAQAAAASRKLGEEKKNWGGNEPRRDDDMNEREARETGVVIGRSREEEMRKGMKREERSEEGKIEKLYCRR